MSAILDTCIVSELYDVNAEPAVVQKVNELGADAYLSVITIGELLRGTQLLEPGRRQRALLESLRRTEQRFAQRILPIDTEVARVWGRITAETRGVGREVPPLDGLIGGHGPPSWDGRHDAQRPPLRANGSRSRGSVAEVACRGDPPRH